MKITHAWSTNSVARKTRTKRSAAAISSRRGDGGSSATTMSIATCMPYLKPAAAPTKTSQANAIEATSPVQVAGCSVT